MADMLGTLRTAKLAKDEDLITQEDFDTIKIAFLKAQQIRAGLDAGFIRQEEYDRTKDAFLHSLDFRMVAAPAPVNGPAPSIKQEVAAAAPAPVVRPVAVPRAQSQKPASQPASQPPSPVLAASSSFPPASMPPSAPAAAAAPVSAPAQPRASVSTVSFADLPKIGKAADTTGKKAMSGISVQDETINVFNHVKTKSAYKWVMYRVDDAGKEVIVEQVGAPDSTYEEFLSFVPEGQCRFAVYDYAYTNADNCVLQKLIFINWAPDTASIKQKMMYAATKDFFKGFLDGIGAEMQASEASELAESEMRERVYAALTRK